MNRNPYNLHGDVWDGFRVKGLYEVLEEIVEGDHYVDYERKHYGDQLTAVEQVRLMYTICQYPIGIQKYSYVF